MSRASLLATQLARHPALRAVDRDTVWARHPGVYDRARGQKVVPAVHMSANGESSVFINPALNRYGDRMLADGRTIEFHPSTNDVVNGRLDRLLGREATMYAFLGRDAYRMGRVLVEAAARGVYHLRLAPAAFEPPAAAVAAAVGEMPELVSESELPELVSESE
jgi:hypothetical protein